MLNIVKKPNPFILKILKKEGFGADCSIELPGIKEEAIPGESFL